MRHKTPIAMAMTLVLAVGGGTYAATSAGKPGDELTSFLVRKGEEPGFSHTGRVRTISGATAFANYLHESSAFKKLLRREGFSTYVEVKLKGPRNAAGVSDVAVFKNAAAAKRMTARDMKDQLGDDFFRGAKITHFTVKGVPGAKGFAAKDVANVFWAQGRCEMILGNQGPAASYVGRLSTGVKAIYRRTKGRCP